MVLAQEQIAMAVTQNRNGGITLELTPKALKMNLMLGELGPVDF